MSKRAEIIHFGDHHLRTQCTPVTVFHKGLHTKIDVMLNTLRNHGGAAALAAPQISLLKRIVVIDYLGEYHELVNPEITEKSGEEADFEGCLSLPGFSGKVTRFKKIKVNYQDRFGEHHTIETNDWMARCFQHEIDHLDGVLYIDRVVDDHVFDNETGEKIAVQRLIDLSHEQLDM